MNCMMCFNCINYLNTVIVQIHTVVKMELENQKNRRYFIKNVIKYLIGFKIRFDKLRKIVERRGNI